MTNAQTARQLGRKAMQESITPDAEVAAQVSVQLAIAHALLDVAAAIREMQPITSPALGPVDIDDPDPGEIDIIVTPDPHTPQELADKIRKSMQRRGQ